MRSETGTLSVDALVQVHSLFLVLFQTLLQTIAREWGGTGTRSEGDMVPIWRVAIRVEEMSQLF